MIEFRGAGVVAASTGARLLEPTTLGLTERRISVIGANGSGKSTLVRLINGLVLPSMGSVLVNDRDTRREASAVRRDVGFLFTDPTSQLIMPTAIEDVSLSLRRAIKGRDARASAALDRLTEIGLEEQALVSVHSLSGGQRQLLALAGVLAVEPSILVADEPTTLLDLRWRAHVDALIDALPMQVIEVTHDLEAARRADRTLVLDGGRVVFDGDPRLAVPFYQDLMSSKSGGRNGA